MFHISLRSNLIFDRLSLVVLVECQLVSSLTFICYSTPKVEVANETQSDISPSM